MNPLMKYGLRANDFYRVEIKRHMDVLLSGKSVVDPGAKRELSFDFDHCMNLANAQEESEGCGRRWPWLQGDHTIAEAKRLKNVMRETLGIESTSEPASIISGYRRALSDRLREYVRHIPVDDWKLVSFEFIAYDMNCLMSSYIADGVIRSEWSVMISECYRHGLWPCGWHGEYPNGHVVVYSRNRSQTSKS